MIHVRDDDELPMERALRAFLRAGGLFLSEPVPAGYRLYMDFLLTKNQSINLTAITDRRAFLYLHYIDSLAALAVPAFYSASSVVDIGTGGGFPAIPLALCCPNKHFVLVDAQAKKLKVVEEISRACGIKNIRLLHARAEDMGRDASWRETFDVCLSRAVAPFSVLAELCLPLLKKEGTLVAYKSRTAEKEIRSAQKAVNLLGGGETEGIDLFMTDWMKDGLRLLHDSDNVSRETSSVDRLSAGENIGEEIRKALAGHVLFCTRKIKSTPPAYPRKAGIPGRKPL